MKGLGHSGRVLFRELIIHDVSSDPSKQSPFLGYASHTQPNLLSNHQDCWAFTLASLSLINTCTNLATRVGHR